MRMKNKKGNVPVTLLVLMSILLAAAALFIFITSGKIDGGVADAGILNKIYLDEGEISFYILNIMESAVRESKGSENFEGEFETNFLKELAKYKKDGKYIFQEFSKVEEQVGGARVEGNKVVMRFRFEVEREENSVHIIHTYDKEFEVDLGKPHLTVFVLDYSGSMGVPDDGGRTGEKELEEAFEELMNLDIFHQSSKDVTFAVLFNEEVISTFGVEGNEPKEVKDFLENIKNTSPEGDTNMYVAVIEALEILDSYGAEEYSTSIIVMSDGTSNEEIMDLEGFKNLVAEKGLSKNVPIYTILFGQAEERQMSALAEWSGYGRVVDGTEDLLNAFIEAKCFD